MTVIGAEKGIGSRLKRFANRSCFVKYFLKTWSIAVYLLLTNLLAAFFFRLGIKLTRSGTRHAGIEDPEVSVNYLWRSFRDYLEIADLDPEDLQDKSVLEVGPGDSVGVALLFLCHGAKEVCCLDKFYSLRNASQHRKIYQALRASLSATQKNIFDEIVTFNPDEVRFDAHRLKVVYGQDIKSAPKIFKMESFDFIVSRAVLEHVSRPQLVFGAMDKILRPKGYLIHKIDFRDHGLFSAKGLHPLIYLSFPEKIYRAMSESAGRPNRMLLPDYEKCIDLRRYQTKFYVTHYLGHKEDLTDQKISTDSDFVISAEQKNMIDEIRPFLAFPYRDYSESALVITGVFLSAKKIGETTL